MDITTLGIAMDTSDLKQGESALDSAAVAANKAADALDSVTDSAAKTTTTLATVAETTQSTAAGAAQLASSYSGVSTASAAAYASGQKYLEGLKQEYDLLGLNRAETEAYLAQAKGFSATQQEMAAALGAKIDAWNREEAASQAASAAQDRASASADIFIAKLQAQVDAIGKTRAELLQFQAAQLGVSEQAAPLIAAIEAQAAATQQLGESEDQATARISAMVAASLEAQAAMTDSSVAAARYAASVDAMAASATAAEQANVGIATSAREAAAAQASATAQFEVASTTISASAAKVAEALGRQLTAITATKAQMIEYDAQMAGFTEAETAQLSAIAQEIDLRKQQLALGEEMAAMYATDASAAVGASAATAGVTAELVTMGREVSNGNYTKLAGSFTRFLSLAGALQLLMNPLTLGVIAVGAAMFEVANQNEKMNEALVMTGDYAGITSDQLRAMADAATAGGATFNTAAEAVTALAATGRLTGEEIASLGQTTADAATYTSASVKQMVDDFTKLAEDPVKASVALNDQYHYLTASTYDQITALMKQGDATGAAQVAVESFSTAMEQRTKDIAANEGIILQGWRDIKAMIDGAVQAVGSFGATATPGEVVSRLQANKAARLPIGQWDDQDEAELQKAIAAYQSAVKQAKDQARAASQQQELIDAKHSYDVWNQQFATPAEKRAKEVQSYIDTIAAPLNLSPEQQLADEQKINDKYKDKKTGTRSAGLIDKTQLQGDVQAVKDALDQELSYVKSAQTQLDALYKSGGISESQYYQQSRDLLAQKATDEIDAYNKQAALLQQSLNDRNLSAQQKAQINNQIQQDQAKAAKATEDFFSAIADSAAQEDAVWQKYGQSQIDVINKQVDSLNKNDQSLRDQIDTFGMTKSAIDDLVVARTQHQLAMEQEGLAMAQLNGVSPDVIASYEKQIAALKELLKAQQAVASDQATVDQLTAVKKVADQTVQDWKSAANSIEQGLTTALMNGFNNGKSFGQSLADSLKSLFKTLILQPIIAPIAGGMASLMYPGASQAYAQTNPNSPLVSLLSGNSPLISGTNSLIGGVSNLFGGLPTGAATTIANSEGGDVLGNFLSLTGNAGSSAASGASSSAGSGFLGASGLSSGLAGAGLGLGLGSLISGGNSAIGHNPMYATGIGTIAGATIGSVVPVIGTALGAAVGGVLGGVVNKLFGGGETRYGALYDSTPSGTINKLSGPSGGDPAADQVQQQIAATYTQMQQLATSLGGSVTGLGDYRAGYEVSPSKGNSWVKTGFGDDVTTTSLSGVKDSTTVLNDFSLAMQQSVIKGLQEANLDKPYADVVSGVDSTKLSATDVTNLINELNTLKSLFDSIQTMGSDFDNLKNASTDAQLAVVNLSGGVSQFSTNASYFEQHFVPAAEQTANQAKSVTDQLAALGESSVTTNDQFRQVVQGIDLTTAAGQQLYAQMLALAPAFDQMTQAAQQAADAQQSLWNQYFSAIYTPDQQLAMSTKQLQAQFDALGVAMPKTNADFQALVENMDTSDPTVKALQNSLLALAPAFAQVTSASDQAAQAAAQAQQQAVQTALGNVQTAYDNQVQAINANITSISNFITQLTNLKQSLSLGSLSTLSPQDKYAAEKQLFEQTSAAAASGDATAQGNLPQVAQDFLTASQAYNASSQAYVDDYNEVQSALDKNIASAQQQLSVAQQQLDATNQMVQGILDLNQTAMTLEQAVTAYFAAGGTTSAAAGAAAAGTYGGSAGGNLNRAQVEATADPTTGLIPYSDANPYGPMGGYSVADWQAANGAVSDATKAAMGMTLGPDGTYGWYAGPVNGSHAGGLDSVPFDGYRAELHKGEAVVTSANNQKLSQMLNIDWSKFGTNDNAALLSEIKSLRAEVAATRQSQQQIAAATLQQSQQQHAETRADMSRQTRHLQATADASQQTANHTRKIK